MRDSRNPAANANPESSNSPNFDSASEHPRIHLGNAWNGLSLQHFRKVSFWPRIRASAHRPKNTCSGLGKNYRKLRLYEDIIGKTLTSHPRIRASTQGELGRDLIFSEVSAYTVLLYVLKDYRFFQSVSSHLRIRMLRYNSWVVLYSIVTPTHALWHFTQCF